MLMGQYMAISNQAAYVGGQVGGIIDVPYSPHYLDLDLDLDIRRVAL